MTKKPLPCLALPLNPTQTTDQCERGERSHRIYHHPDYFGPYLFVYEILRVLKIDHLNLL